MFKATFSKKFRITLFVDVLVALLIAFGAIFLMRQDISMEDGTPMGGGMKMFFVTMFFAVAISWCLSAMTLLKQNTKGYAFYIDSEGIHNTISGGLLFAFSFFVPVWHIPFDAIVSVGMREGVLVAELDKTKVKTAPIFRPFVRKEYAFLFGLVNETPEAILSALNAAREGQLAPLAEDEDE